MEISENKGIDKKTSLKIAALLLFLTVFTSLSILTRHIINKQTDLNSQAAEVLNASSAVRGDSNDQWADVIIGKKYFNEDSPNIVAPGKVFYPRSVIVDRSNPSANKLYVYDGGNSRILGFDLTTCLAHQTNPLNCIPDIIIGQPAAHPQDQDFGTTGSCNGDSGYQNFPNRTSSASTLCSLPENQLSVHENGTGSSMDISPQGDLYVSDMYNHRVLKYNNPFTSDTVADEVWGQTDFAGNTCNKGQSSPDASSLCFGWSGNNNWVAGVDVDDQGNLWVADDANNRVLRFPPGSHTANYVLGQTSFTTRSSGSGLNQLFAPAAVRVASDGAVFVADSTNNRVLKFSPPFDQSNYGKTGEVFGTNFILPDGIDLDPNQPGKLWIANRGHHDYELWNTATGALERTLGTRDNGNIANEATGSIGIDSTGNYFVGAAQGNYGNDVLYFPASGPYNNPSKLFFGGGNTMNLRDAHSLDNVQGVAIYNNGSSSQLMVLSTSRVMYWNFNNGDLTTLSNEQPANGMLEITDFSSTSPTGYYITMKASRNHLYVSRSRHTGPSRVEIYNLPLTPGAQPIGSITYPINVLNGGQIDVNQNLNQLDQNFSGIAPSADDSYLWLSQADGSRVIRIKNPLDAANRYVDVVLGQLGVNNLTDVNCNRGGTPITGDTPNSLCWPGFLSLDKLGNLWVSDHSLETRGNMRLLMFQSSLFPANLQQVLYAPSATKIFPDCGTWETAFDSQNHMVAGYDAYLDYCPHPAGTQYPIGMNASPRWPGIYLDPVNPLKLLPDMFIQDFHSSQFALTFDDNNNLYIGDINRSRVLIYKTPLNTSSPTIVPSVTVQPTVPINTPIPTVTIPVPTPTSSSIITLTNIGISAVANTSAIITWTTNIASSSKVTYGEKQNNLNLSSQENQTLVTNHSVTLTNLKKNVRYFYKVYSRNAQGQLYSSAIFNFRTSNLR